MESLTEPERRILLNEHFSYEVESMCVTGEAFWKKNFNTPSYNLTIENRAINRALWESFILHARVLICFFYEEPRLDDVSAGSFATGYPKPYPAEWIRTSKDAANRRLAHLTRERLKPAHDWSNFTALGWRLMKEVTEFCILPAVKPLFNDVGTARISKFARFWEDDSPAPYPEPLTSFDSRVSWFSISYDKDGNMVTEESRESPRKPEDI